MNCIEMPLRGSGQGLVRFHIAGAVGNRPARADWDGRVLRLTATMSEAVSLSTRVEEAFVPAAQRRPGRGASRRPMIVAVELVRSLDQLELIDYVVAGPAGRYHRRWRPATSAPASPSPGDAT